MSVGFRGVSRPRARRSLSIGGLRSQGGSGKESDSAGKGGRQGGQGWMSDGEEAEGGFSPIGHEVRMSPSTSEPPTPETRFF